MLFNILDKVANIFMLNQIIILQNIKFAVIVN